MKKKLTIVQAQSKPGKDYVKITPEIAVQLQQLVDSIDDEIQHIHTVISNIKKS